MTDTNGRLVDLFCGAGGLSEGFRQAGYEILAGSDIDPDACATYRLNFPDATTICGDLREPDIRKAVVEAGANADVLAGGPPCQGFSQVRNHARLIDDPKNSLYREFVGLVDELEPKLFVMENVPGMAQMGVVDQVKADLVIGGKYIVDAKLVDAANFGVPQTRKRIIFIGVHTDLGTEPPEIDPPDVTTALALGRNDSGEPAVRAVGKAAESYLERLTDPWDDGIVSVEQAIGDLTSLQAGTNRQDEQPSDILGDSQSAYQKAMRDGLNGAITNVGVPRINKDTVIRLNAIPAGGNYLDLPEGLTERYITGARWGQDNGSGVLSRKHFYAYRRLHPDIWSWTLNTKADSVYHWSAARALAVREFARLQSFPDRFIVTTDPRKGELPGRIDGGPAHSRYRQIGNAVPPLLARAVATAVSEVLR